MFGICLPNYYICNRNEKKIKQVNINLTIFKEMNKKLFFLAIAALGLAACSNDDVVEINQGEAISFRPLVNNVTRAADIDASYLQGHGFTVFATEYGKPYSGNGSGPYFPETEYTFSAGTWTSTSKHYWPSSGSIDFYAYAYSGAENQVTHTAQTLVFGVTPNATAANQTDLVFANTNNKSKGGTYGASDEYTYGAHGVPLNFRHAESKVTIQLKNTNSSLKFTVNNVRIGNIKTTGTYTYSGSTSGYGTDGENSAYLKFEDWTPATPGYYDQVPATTTYTSATATTALTSYILIPQAMTAAGTYENGDNNAAFLGPYITIELKIQNADNNAYILGSAQDFVTALWPLTTVTWNPGYHYTYTVDLAGGGYNPTNVNGTNENLDPVLNGAEIKFVSVTVDAWADGGTINVGNN